MTIIKCSTCGKNVSDDSAMCPNCGNDLDKAVLCPKCGSDDTDLLLKWVVPARLHLFVAFFAYLFDHGFRAWRTALSVYEEGEYVAKVRRICNSCGKKFKVKRESDHEKV